MRAAGGIPEPMRPLRVRELLASDLVTTPTREALEARLARPPVTVLRFFDADTFRVLQAVCSRLLPQPDRTHPVDIAGELDSRLAEGKGDGWRYDVMPPDGEACRRGTRALDETARVRHQAAFADLDEVGQDGLLALVARGDAPAGVWRDLPPERFFEELLAAVVEIYYSHPLAQDEIGYVGMADAHGWQGVGLGALEIWERGGAGSHGAS